MTLTRITDQSAETGAITAPSWYASFAYAGASAAEPAARDDRCVRFGPLAVFRGERGCQTAPFRDGQPGVVLFHGYLFDREVLARELGITDEPESDAHLAAGAYQRWGTDVFDQLDGCYLLAISDPRDGCLLIGHDALGRHPVFFSMAEDRFWFGPNVLALASSGHIPPRPNRLSLALQIASSWPEAGQTFFDRIHRLRPGHYLELRGPGRTIERRYWQPYLDDDEPYVTDEDVLEQFETLFGAAVRRCMRLGAQGIMLSGGLDSVTVAALAAEYTRAEGLPPLVAFSGRTGYEISAEEARQSVTADALGMPHFITTRLECLDGQDEIERSLDATPWLPSPSPTYWVGTYTEFYRRAARQGLKALMTGSGGDNWLGRSATHMADLIRAFRIPELVGTIRDEIRLEGTSSRAAVERLLWTWGLRPHVDALWGFVAPERKLGYHRRKWHERLPRWLCPDAALRDALVEHLLARRVPPLTEGGRIPRNYYRHASRTFWSNPYLHYEFEIGHHMQAVCGVRLLAPYHDRRLATFARRIAPGARVHLGRDKGVLRPILAKRLPGLGLDDQRKEYPAEETRRTQRELRDSIANTWPRYRFEALGSLGVVDPDVLQKNRGEYDGSRLFDVATQKFMLMTSELWTRHHTR